GWGLSSTECLARDQIIGPACDARNPPTVRRSGEVTRDRALPTLGVNQPIALEGLERRDHLERRPGGGELRAGPRLDAPVRAGEPDGPGDPPAPGPGGRRPG